jgi:hypothetical protein
MSARLSLALLGRSAFRLGLALALLWQLALLLGPVPSASAASEQYSLWDASAAPATPAESDSQAVEVGVKFRSSADGYITAVRFYKGTTATGSYVGNLWSAQGARLATATFSPGSATGWQQASFATPVAIQANTTYVASYYTSIGRYAADQSYFTGRSVTRGPLTALADGTSGSNGVYRYGTSSGFPTSSYRATNYWVDVVFVPSASTTPVTTATPTAPAATPTTQPTATATAPTATPTAATPTATATPPTPTATAPAATATPTSGALANGYTTVGALTLKATYQSIGVYAGFSGDADADNRASLEYRRVGEATWHRGMDLTPDRRQTVFGAGATYDNPFKNQWRGSVLLAQPDTDYEVRVTWADPDGVSGANPVVAQVRTRSETTPAAGATYYVSPAGADTNPGTIAAPWKTLAKAAGAVNAGDTVLVRAGTYSPVSLSRSGTAAAWVQFKAYPGERPVISAAAGSGTLASITGSYVRFGGFELVGGQWGVVVGGSAHDVVVEQNIVRGQQASSQSGVAIQIGNNFSTQSAVANVTVQDNDVRADTTPEPETDVILVVNASGGHVIRRNRIVFSYQGGGVHGTDCIGGLPNFSPTGGYFADTDVNDNYCDGATDDSIEVDGGNANVRIWGNTIVRGNGGFSITPVYYGPVYVFRNVVYGLKDHWVGSCYAVKDGEGGTGAVYFYHNTFDSPSGSGCNNIVKGFVKYGSGNPSSNVVIKNNILHFWGRLHETGSKIADQNLNYVETGSGDKVAKWNNTDYYSFTSFQSGAGQERSGLWGKASYVNAAGGDFHLAAGSLGVDRGVSLPGFNGADSPWPDHGTGPDVGAFES